MPGAAAVADGDHADGVQQQRGLRGPSGTGPCTRSVCAVTVACTRTPSGGFGVDRQQGGDRVDQGRRARVQAGGQVVPGRGGRAGADRQRRGDGGVGVVGLPGWAAVRPVGQVSDHQRPSWARSTSSTGHGLAPANVSTRGLGGVVGVGDHGQGVGPGLAERRGQPRPHAVRVVHGGGVDADGHRHLPVGRGRPRRRCRGGGIRAGTGSRPAGPRGCSRRIFSIVAPGGSCRRPPVSDGSLDGLFMNVLLLQRWCRAGKNPRSDGALSGAVTPRAWARGSAQLS